jgi:two-component system, OmpR family, phosphate regulon response regulator PhoB
MARILIIEDDADLNKVLAFNLREAGHEPLSALRGGDGLRLAEREAPDLVVLDLMLPDLPGTEVCRRLKQASSTRVIPVLILTARGEEVDRVVGFELGAEDYVVKPFSLRELMLRIGVILQRRQAAGPERPAEHGLLRIDQAAHRVWVGKREVELTPLEYRLLLLLFDRRDTVQSRATLLGDVWGGSGQSSRTVDTHITRLREKLGRAGRYIETVRSVGYRFSSDEQD